MDYLSTNFYSEEGNVSDHMESIGLKKGASIKTSRLRLEKLHLSNVESQLRGKEGPGPAAYAVSGQKPSGGRF
ncbi:MAG: hypothetical protein V2I33_20960 [Kangiellaceae bacterium]|jgi:hypothetical protein|nr:hypothetical protein [Kangiellaceae bacterium]